MNIVFSKIIKLIIPFSFVMTFAYFIDTTLYIYLPKNSNVHYIIQDKNLQYKRYNIRDTFQEKKKKVAKEKKKKIVIKEYQLLSNIDLKAIYATSNSKKGWIIIAEKNRSKTYILSVNETFKNYTLTDVFINYVLFTKNNKAYKVSLNNVKTQSKYTVKKSIVKNDDVDIEDNTYKLKKKVVYRYIKDPDKIWNNISISEILVDGKIDGFKVSYVRNGSIFEKLGLIRGDIIKEANNIKLTSYASALNLYKMIDKIKNIHLLIIRDNMEMELDYEIK